MRRRIIFMFITGFIWLALVAGVCTYLYIEDTLPTEYTHYNDYAVDESHLYVTENKRNYGFIYAIDTNARVAAMYDSRDFANGGLFEAVATHTGHESGDVLAVLRREVVYQDESIWTWQVLTFDPMMNLKYASEMLHPQAGSVVTDIEAEDDAIYLTFIDSDGSNAYSCQIGYESLLPGLEAIAASSVSTNRLLSTALGDVTGANAVEAIAETSGEQIDTGIATGAVIHVLPVYLAKEADPGHFIVKGIFRNGMVQILQDGDANRSEYVGNDNVRSFFALKQMDRSQLLKQSSHIVRGGAIAAGIGLVVIFLLIMLIGSRSRNIYTILTAELLILVMTVAGVIVTYRVTEKTREDTSDEFAMYAVSSLYDSVGPLNQYNYAAADFYESQEYRDLQRKLADFVGYRGNRNVFYDAMIIDTATGNIVVSASGQNFLKASDVYSSGMDNAIWELMNGRESTGVSLMLSAQKYRALAVRGTSDFSPSHIIAGVVNRSAIGDDFIRDRYAYILLGLIIFIGCSLIIVGFMYVQSLDIRRVVKGMEEIAAGELYSEKGAMIMGRDLDTMWNALYEIDKRVRKINYTKFLIFESYYRFAPKAIERILGKSSITEVKSGDMTNFSATVGLISTRDQQDVSQLDVDRLGIQLEVIAKYQDDEKGILISNDCSLSLMRMMFMAISRETAQFGIYLMHVLEDRLKNENISTFMLLHYDEYLYGVAGNQSQAAAFLSSSVTEELSDYVPWLRGLNTRLLVTEAVKKREVIPGMLRHIGYIQSRDPQVESIHLYEVLDAESEHIRVVKMAGCDRFHEALELFYRQDYYLSRNLFTELLKTLPEDGVARWYIFECERYLNMEEEVFDGSLKVRSV